MAENGDTVQGSHTNEERGEQDWQNTSLVNVLRLLKMKTSHFKLRNKSQALIGLCTMSRSGGVP